MIFRACLLKFSLFTSSFKDVKNSPLYTPWARRLNTPLTLPIEQSHSLTGFIHIMTTLILNLFPLALTSRDEIDFWILLSITHTNSIGDKQLILVSMREILISITIINIKMVNYEFREIIMTSNVIHQVLNKRIFYS